MKIYSTLQIGSFHTNHCEDFTITTALGQEKQLIAVMDGCTMGEESVFASILLGKILKNISKKYYYQDLNEVAGNPGLKTYLKEILRELISETKRIKNQLGLEPGDYPDHSIVNTISRFKQQKNTKWSYSGAGRSLLF